MRLNKTIVHEDGTVDSIEEQLINLEKGNFDPTMPLIVAKDSKCLNCFETNVDKPITMRVSTAFKIKKRHQLDFSFIAKCLNSLDQAVLVFDSLTQPTSRVILLDLVNEETGNPYVVICRTDKVMSSVEVNEITSIYDKKNFDSFLDRTYHNNCKFYKNKKKRAIFHLDRLQWPRELIFALSNNYSKLTFIKKQVDCDIAELFLQQANTSLEEKMAKAKLQQEHIIKDIHKTNKELENEK